MWGEEGARVHAVCVSYTAPSPWPAAFCSCRQPFEPASRKSRGPTLTPSFGDRPSDAWLPACHCDCAAGGEAPMVGPCHAPGKDLPPTLERVAQAWHPHATNDVRRIPRAQSLQGNIYMRAKTPYERSFLSKEACPATGPLSTDSLEHEIHAGMRTEPYARTNRAGSGLGGLCGFLRP